jgi:hypothetical protein
VINGTLEELWISYNSIEKFDGILTMKKLRVNLSKRKLGKIFFYLGSLYE